jgi:hypothetical protein
MIPVETDHCFFSAVKRTLRVHFEAQVNQSQSEKAAALI